jgi:hypothetical protein
MGKGEELGDVDVKVLPPESAQMDYAELCRKSEDVIADAYANVGPEEIPPPGMILIGGKDPGILTFRDVPYENVLEMASVIVETFEPDRWSLWTLSRTDEGAESVTMQVTEGDHDENWHSLVTRTETEAPRLGEWKQIPTGGRLS